MQTATSLPLVLHFVDTETTGLESDTFEPEVLSYAIVRWTDGKIETLCHRFLTPVIAPTADVCEFNGYSLERWTELNAGTRPPVFSFAHAGELQEYLGNRAVIVGSNPDFDKRRLQYECRQLNLATPTWHHRSINLSSFAGLLRAAGLIAGTGLSDATAHFGLDTTGRHTALGDCMIGIQVFERFISEFVLKPKAWRDALEEIAAPSGTPSRDCMTARLALEVGT